MKLGDIGLIGLAVMGENLALNMESKGYTVSVFNRSTNRVDDFVNGRAKGKNFIPTHSIKELVESLKVPRKVFLMIKAGKPVDGMIDSLLEVLDKGDIIIDGGNSLFMDTIRRTKYVEEKGLYYIGTGVSGGEEGALKGPSIMPGGSKEAYDAVSDILQSISAKVNGEPCCDYVGANGAGHFVKMVHNGIEYGDMQLICESYALLSKVLKINAAELGDIFTKYNQGKLESYLIEITSHIFKYQENGEPLVEKILDCAGQKGTGKWAVEASLEEGIPLTLIGEAVFARCLSSMKDERALGAEEYPNNNIKVKVNKEKFIKNVEDALYAAKIISYAQGYSLMASAAKTYDWSLNYGQIALMWRGGCIIRSAFLGKIKEAYEANPKLPNLLLDPYFKKCMNDSISSLREVCKVAIDAGVAIPSFTSALAYFDGYRTLNSPANLLQAQRDYFGAHTYERKDHPRGEVFHTNWTGEGGSTTSNTYNA